MPLAVKVVLVVAGVVLLSLALIGSGISRRLMTIPKMHRGPRIALAVVGVLLLFAGGWQLTSETERHGPTLAALKTHIPSAVTDSITCEEASEAPKGAVEMACGAGDSVPEYAYYVMFPDVNSMQDYWMREATPEDLQGSDCGSKDDYTTGSNTTYSLSDESVTVGDLACWVDSDGISWAAYTDRRYNIVVEARQKDPKGFDDFLTWVDGTSQPEGTANDTPASPTRTAAAGR